MHAGTDQRSRANARCLFWSAVIVLLVLVVWAVLGIGAFVTSLVCLSRNGTSRSALGVLLAALLGPLYWVYYALYARCLAWPTLASTEIA
jgi:hypothetical protein